MENRALRVGLTAILCALVMRLFAAGVPEKLFQFLLQPNTLAFLTYLETGRNVRFSPSLDTFSPAFVESPPPAIPQPTEAPLPCFSERAIPEIYNTSNKKPELQILLEQPLQWDLKEDGPTVLILHTHTTESYTQAGENYVESASWRTLDENYNMLSIGSRVGEILEENGITVIHDRQLHDHPSYNGSYTRTRQTMEELLQQYPTVRLVLDLHRDAVEAYGRQLGSLAEDGKTAQMMLVMGTNFENWKENLSLALKLHTLLEEATPGIMRPLQLRPSRFNQDLNTGAVLIEIGAAGNTHSQAINAAEKLADAIIALANGTA
ncbi:MAG: stage II sporulation protein P [Oscillibacter sp.]|nr:stage II sporulation protein P [Oscillibacter sp.]